MNFKPNVSVIVPVYQNIEYLSCCLDSLTNQIYPKECYEIIVIDNNPQPLEEIKNIAVAYPTIKLLHQPKPGSYAARNTGVRASHGSILAFTDADCLISPNWITSAVEILQNNIECKYLAGPIHFFPHSNRRVASFQWHEQINSFPKDKFLVEQKGAPTANLFTYRNVFNTVGLFNENLKSGGDIEWGQRVNKANLTQIFDQNVYVNHPLRKSMKEYLLQMRRISGGVYEHYFNPNYSFLRRQIQTVFLIGNDLVEVFATIKKIYNFKNKDLKSKFGIYVVAIYIGFIKALEKIRVHFGGETKRL